METLIDILIVIAAICGVLVAYFKMLDARQNDEKQRVTREKYADLWSRLEGIGIHSLFQKLLRPDTYIKIGEKYPAKWIIIFVIALLTIIDLLDGFLMIRQWGQSDIKWFSPALSSYILILVIIPVVGLFFLPKNQKIISEKRKDLILAISLLSIVVITFGNYLYKAALISGFGGDYMHYEFNFFQKLIVANVICDVITILCTYQILLWIQKANLFPFTLFAILFDIAIAAFLATVALYYGLLGTPEEITHAEAINILLFKFRDGSAFGIDPYFWIMHTTFIPTLIYLSILFLALVAKYPATWITEFLTSASTADKPHLATATTFAFIGILASTIVALLKWL